MKRRIAIFLACVCAAVLSACGSTGGRTAAPTSTSTSTAPAPTTSTTVATEAVYSTCSSGLPEVFYTVPQGGGFTVKTSIDGEKLATWYEDAGQEHTPVVVGLPTSDEGQKFTVDAGVQSATVVVAKC